MNQSIDTSLLHPAQAFSGYQQNTAALGRTAADKLIELIEHPRVTLPEQIRVSGKLLDGGSVSIL